MTEETKYRALHSIKTMQMTGGNDWHFPFVFVVGTHIFYFYMPAVRMQKAIKYEEGIDLPIEIVRHPESGRVRNNMDQKGELMPGEVFPSKEYARLIAQ